MSASGPGSAAAQGAPRRPRVVRVPSSAIERLAQLGIAPRRDLDYGAFHWIELAEEDAARLADAQLAFEEVEGAGEVHVPGYRFDPVFDGPPRVPARFAQREGRSLLRLVQFHGPARKEWLSDLEARGLKVLQYYPQNTYLVRDTLAGRTSPASEASAQTSTAAAQPGPYVRWQGPFQPAYKIEQQLATMRGLVQNVDIAFLNDGDVDATLQALRGLGARIVRHYRAQPDAAFYDAVVEIDAGSLEAVAALPNVVWLGYQPPKPTLTDEMSDQIQAGEVTNGVPTPGYRSFLSSDLSYDGTGVTWAIVDTGVNWDHPDLASHMVGGYDQPGASCIVAGRPGSDCYGHGTHVAGIVAGDATAGHMDANGFLYGLGVAPGASLFAMNVLSSSQWPWTDGFQDTSKRALLGGAVGANNSWAMGKSQSYGTIERTHDLMVRDGNFDTTTVAEPFIEVFSAANFGQPYSLGSPAAAKNVISVASSDNYRLGDFHAISSFSSRGPTADGRIAPTITAPGAMIASARDEGGQSCADPIDGTDGAYAFCSGTSMSSPHVSGALALVTEWWRGLPGHNGANPSPAMAKALLVNGATQMGSTPIPNPAEGWGLVNLRNTIEPRVSRVFHDQDTLLTSTGTSFDIPILLDPTQPLKVTLAWTDAPGALGADPALVNDLDLIVSTNGETYRGNVFANGWSMAGGAPDHLNNLENVYVQEPGTRAVITVRATALNGDGVPYNGDLTDQDFAIVCTNCNADTTPGLGITVLPAQQRVCQPASTSLQVTAAALNGFSGPVDLTALNLPTSMSASFSPNPVSAGGTSTLTISGASAATVGSHSLMVMGLGGGRSGFGSAELWVDAALAVPTLVSPEAGGVAPTTPTYTWSDIGAAAYAVEVATDAAFSNVVYSASGIVGTSHTPRPSLALTIGSYYWRVRAQNACGSTVSSARRFTTYGAFQGYVTDSSGTGLAYVDIFVYNASGGYVAYLWTDSSGHYTSPALPPGSYFAYTSYSGYIDELYNNIPCPAGYCTVTSGTPINVAAGSVTSGISFALAPGGRVSGKVTNGSGTPLKDIWIQLYTPAGNITGSAVTDDTGAYTSVPLPAGTYYARTSNSLGYLDELYDDVPCTNSCTVTNGKPIAVSVPNTTSGINFALAQGGRISGTVRSTTDAALANVNVTFYDSVGTWVGSVNTDGSGAFASGGLPSGAYYARTSNSLGYLDEQYDDVPCANGSCSVTAGTAIVVTAPDTSPGIDFALAQGGRISGTIRSTADAPLANVNVTFYDSTGNWAGSANTDASGAYTSSGLPSGTYYARTYNALGYLDEVYDDIPCVGYCASTTGTPIAVTAPNTAAGIDFALAAGGRISGNVKSNTDAPLAGVSIFFYDSAGSSAGSASTDASGHYTSSGLPSGTYYVKTSNSLGYVDQLYSGITCPGWSCTVTSGTPVSVTIPDTTSGIDFALAPGGRISGKIENASGAALGNVNVELLDAAGRYLGSAYTDTSGAYTSIAVPAGKYYARTYNSQGYLDELYDDVLCPGGRCALSAGKALTLTASNTTSGIDFVLAQGGRISGTVRNTDGAPLMNISLEILDVAGRSAGSGYTDAAGHWISSGLLSGTYYVRTYNSSGYIDQLYDRISCPNWNCDRAGGTPVSVSAPNTTSGVDFALARGARVSGRITDASGTPLRGVSVSIRDASGRGWGSGYTDASGSYLSTGLPSGTYYVTTYNSLGYLDELYDDIPCPAGSCAMTAGRAVSATAPETTNGVDFALAAGGRIRGRVLAADGTALSNVSVGLFDLSGSSVGYGYTDTTGSYTTTAVPAGSYYARTYNSLRYVDELYDNVPCRNGACGLGAGTPIPVALGATTGPIDFILEPEVLLSIWDVTVTEADSGTTPASFAVTLSSTGSQAPTNVALGKTATQSSTANGGAASRAVDGNTDGAWTNGSVTHTAEEARPYWQVDLGRAYWVGEVRIFNRTDCCSGRLANFDVMVSLDGATWTSIYVAGAAQTTSVSFAGRAGRFVRVQLRGTNYLSLAEVEVMGVPLPGVPISVDYRTVDGTAVAGSDYQETSGTLTFAPGQAEATITVPIIGDTVQEDAETFRVVLSNSVIAVLAADTATATIAANDGPDVLLSISDVMVTEADSGTTPANFAVTLTSTGSRVPTNVALGKMATQSSTAYGGVASRAVDGNTDGAWTNGSVTSTAEEVRPYWQVDLGGAYWVGEVRIFNRTDCCSERLANFDVMVSLDGATWTSIYVAGAAQTTSVSFAGRAGRFVRVQLRGTNYLSLAEVEVMGVPLPSVPVSVDYRTEDGTAVAGSDYQETTGTLTFAPGQATATITVPIIGDTVQEDAETFRVVLSNPVAAVLAADTATATIAANGAPVFWRNVVGATASGNNLTKTAATGWGSGGASSLQQITGNGYAEFTVTETTTYRMAGLANGDSNQHYNDIDFAVYLAGTSLQVYEGGTTRFWSTGTISPGDRIRIAVSSGVVRYYQNGVLLYTSTNTPRLPLCLDTSLYDQGSTISNARIFAEPSPAGPPVAVIAAPAEGRVGTPITFDGTWSWDPDGSVVEHVWDFGDGTPAASGAIVTHTYASGGPFTVTLTVRDNGGLPASATQTEKISQLVFWRNVVGATATNNNLAKTAVSGWGNAGASSIQVIPAEGYVEFTVPDTTGRWMAGLSNGDSDQTYKDIDFAAHPTQGNLLVFEGGTSRDVTATVAAGDRIRIAVASGVVKYYRNGTLLYTSTVAPTLPLCLDAALYDQGAAIADATIFAMPGAPGPPVAVITAKAEGRAGNAISFDGTGSWDSDGTVVDYSWDFGDGTTANGPTVTHTYTFGAAFPVTLTVHDNSGLSGSTSQNERISQSVFWKNVVGATASGANLTKTAAAAWGNAGASSVQQIAADGWVEFTVPDTYGRWMAGLSNGDADQTYKDIDFAVHQTQGSLLVYESGVGYDPSLTAAAGDRIRVAAESGVVRYYKNGTLIYTSAGKPRFPLCLDTSLYDQGATIADATVFAPTASPGAPMALISGPTTGSLGTPITLDGSASWDPDGTIVHYYWYFGDGEMGEGPIVSHSFPPGTYAVQLTVVDDRGNSNTSAPFVINIAEPLFWMNVVGATAAGNNLTKTAVNGWGNAGAVSTKVLPSDGWVEITASETTTSRMFGLSHGDSNQSYTDIDFAMYLNSGNLLVFEAGTQQGSGAFTTYATGDLLRVSVSGGVVRYSKNGTVFYTSTATPTFPLLVDTSLLHQGATISGAFVFAKPGPAASPVAIISGPTEGRVGSPLAFDGRGSWDSDGQVVSWSWDFGDGNTGSGSTVTHTYGAGGPFTLRLTVTDNLGLTGSVTQVVRIAEPVEWMNVIGATATGNSLTKTAANSWSNAGAVSTRVIASGEGWVEVTASETTTNRMFGLSSGDTNQSYTDIDFAMYLNGGNLLVFEGGTQQGSGAFTTFATGDRLRVSAASGIVRYSKNGLVFYTSTATPTLPLLVDTSLFNQGATIQDATIYVKPAAAGPPVAQILGPTDGRVGVPMTFDGRGSWDPDGAVVAWNWDFGDGSTASGPLVTHTYSSAGAFQLALTVADNSGSSVSLTQTEKIADVVTWTNVVGATASGNNLTKTAANGWGNAGAVSTRAVASGSAWVEVTASETTTNRMFGLSRGDSNQSYTDIDFAIYLNGGNLLIYEGGTQQGDGAFTTYVSGDRLRVSVSSGIVRYSKNGVVFYTSTGTPTYPLLVDTALSHQGATIQDAVLFAP